MNAETVLRTYRKIAVVGLSPNPDRPSHSVTEHMIDAGFEVVGVNPGQTEILGRPCYSSLKDVPGSLEIVNVFRSSEYLAAVVDDAIRLNAKVLWVQLGIHDADAEERARQAGLTVITDQCIMVVHASL